MLERARRSTMVSAFSKSGSCQDEPARNSGCPGYLVYSIKKGTLRSDWSWSKGKRMLSWLAKVSWTKDAVLERESAPERVCKVLEEERASEIRRNRRGRLRIREAK